jgi:DNA replication protein DnaC
MNAIEMDKALRRLRLSGMAEALEPRLLEARASKLSHIDFLSALVSDELQRRGDRLIGRRITQARFRDQGKTLDSFDFDFNKKMDRATVFNLATGHFLSKAEDALFLGPPGTGKSHLAQAVGHAAILQGWSVAYREAHMLVEELAEAGLDGTRKDYLQQMERVPLLIIDDLGMRKLPATASSCCSFPARNCSDRSRNIASAASASPRFR